MNVAAGATVTISATNTAVATATTTPTAVISAVMIGDAGAPPVTGGTQAPQGNWSKAYGAAGYDLAGWNGTSDLSWMPNATVTLDQGSRAVQAATTTDARALSDADRHLPHGSRLHRSQPGAGEADLQRSAYTGNIHLYSVDWDTTARRELITVNGQTAELSSDFGQGAWVSFPITEAAGDMLTVTVDRTAGTSAVLSGIFLGEAPGQAPTAQISAPADNQTYNQGQQVPTQFSCSDHRSRDQFVRRQQQRFRHQRFADRHAGHLDDRSSQVHGHRDQHRRADWHRHDQLHGRRGGDCHPAGDDAGHPTGDARRPRKPVTPPTGSPPPVSTPPVTVPALRLRAVHARPGYTGLIVTGPDGARVKLSEKLGAKTVQLGVVRLVKGTATLTRAVSWRCTPLQGTVVATTLSPAKMQRTTLKVTTPPCSKRLATTITRHSGVAGTILVKLR